MRVIVQRNGSYSVMDRGEANGYLVISDPTQVWYGKHYDEIDVEVHGDLTYSQMVDEDTVACFDELTDGDIGSWMVGFDTCHLGDTAERWPVDSVRKHAREHLLNITISA